MALLLRHIDLLATRTKYLHPRCSDLLTHSDWQGVLSLAENSWADSKSPFDELVPHDGEALGRDYVPGVYESIDISGFLVDGEISVCVEEYL